jgi:thiol-disulfide isomerase/thioredoxin
VQTIWIVRNLDLLRPMRRGDEAPAIALAEVGPAGTLGAPVTLASKRGHVVILDFWATWCGPCLAAMPHLDAWARQHPDAVVLAINLDDAKAARALFDERGYVLTLVEDDGEVSQRYGVQQIPHTVAIDSAGIVVGVLRGGDLDSELAAILQK